MTHLFVAPIIPDMEVTIGRRLLDHAQRTKGWSGEQLADKLGVTYETVRKWAQGDTAPNRNRVKTIIAVFGVTEQWVRYGTEDGPAATTEPITTASALGHLSSLLNSLGDLQKAMCRSALQVFLNDPSTWKEVAVQIDALAGDSEKLGESRAKVKPRRILRDGEQPKVPTSRNAAKKTVVA